MNLSNQYYSRIDGIVEILPEYERYRTQALEHISCNSKDKEKQVIDVLVRSIDNDILIPDEDLSKLQSILTLIEDTNKTWNSKIGELLSKQSIASKLVDIFRRYHDNAHIEQCSLNDPSLSVFLANIEKLEFLDARLEILKCELIERFKSKAQDLEKLAKTEIKTLKGIYEILIELKNSCSQLSESCNSLYSDLITVLLYEVDHHTRNPCLEKQRMTDEDIKSIHESLNWLELFHNNRNLEQLVLESQNKLTTSPFDQVVEKLKSGFDRINHKVQTVLRESGDNISMEETEILVKQLAVIRQLPQVESVTAESYYETLLAFRSYIAQIQKNVETIVSSVIFIETPSLTDYRRLERQLSRLKHVSELDKYHIDQRSIPQKIIEDINLAISSLHDRMNNLCKVIPRLREKDFEQLIEVYNSMSDMEPLRKLVQEVDDGMKIIHQDFRDTLLPIHKRFEKEFTLISLEEKKKRIEKLKEVILVLEDVKKQLNSNQCQDLFTLSANLESAKEEFQKYDKFRRDNKVEIENRISQAKISLAQVEDSEFETRSNDLNLLRTELKNFQKESELKIKPLEDHIRKLTLLNTNLRKKIDMIELGEEESTNLLICDTNVFQKELNDLENQVSCCPQIAKYDFHAVVMDTKSAEQAIMFYEKLALARVWKTSALDIPRDTESKLREFVIFYTQYFSQAFESDVQTLINYISEKGDSCELDKVITKLITSIERLKSIETSERLRETISETREIQYGEKYRSFILTRLMQSLESEIKIAGEDDCDRQEFTSIIEIASQLVRLDFYYDKLVNGESFRRVYDLASKKLQDDRANGVKEFRDRLIEYHFEEATKMLNEISKSGMKDRQLEGLKREFNNSMGKFVESTEDIVEELEQKIEEKGPGEYTWKVKLLCTRLERLKSTASNDGVHEYLLDPTKELVRNCGPKVNQALTDTISKGCTRIKNMIDLDSFDQAEKWLENLRWFQSKLSDYINSQRISNEINEVTVKLDELANEIEKREAFSDISKWAEYSPKKLVAKLVDLQEINASHRYARAKESALRNTKDCYQKKFEEAKHKIELHELELVRDELKRAREYLPETHLGDFDHRLNLLSSKIKREGINFEKRLNNAFKELDKEGDRSFVEVLALHADIEEKSPNAATRIEEEVAKRLRFHQQQITELLNSDKMDQALTKVPHVLLYQANFRSFLDIPSIVEATFALFQDKIETYKHALLNVEQQPPENVLLAIKGLKACLDQENNHSSLSSLDQSIVKIDINEIQVAFESAEKFFVTKSTEFVEALNQFDLSNVSRVIQDLLKWKKILTSPEFLASVSRVDILDIDRLTSKLSLSAEHIYKQLDETVLIPEDSKQFVEKRLKLVSVFANWYSRLVVFLDWKKFPVNLNVDLPGLKSKIDAKIIGYGKRLTDVSSQPYLSELECVEFKDIYELLIDLHKQQVFEALYLDSRYLQISQSNILQNISQHRVDIEKLSNEKEPDIEAIAKHLIEMKKLEQNLLFASEIYQKIDEALKFFKDKQHKTLGLGKLATILGASDYGNKLVSDHKTLSGEDLRMRREKMQKQDNLEEMLNKLEGNHLDKDSLRESHEHYKRLYDELIKRGLAKLVVAHSGSNTNDIIFESVSKATELVRTVKMKNGNLSGNLIRGVELPQLLACVCSVWTLLNTEDYNEERGNDKMAYVLTPHVAQIVSIFRILGVGFTGTHRGGPTFAPFLRNCLVEVGTGEGKSLILGMTASIFALLGCEVECSCYSEYLSQRDYEAFISVFRAFNIEDKIEYNTFNKICEKLLNDQCNVREEIRDGILRNDVPRGSNRKESYYLQPKRILLIDEVDVFLSDRFYGGMYIPTLLLPGGEIKRVLDFIWERRGTMNPKGTGYKCSLSIRDVRERTDSPFQLLIQKHGKWQDVIYEAVKDMLQALKSFRTVHYRVEDDKVKYLEGESYVSNVMHGYQTVWTYYHEFQQGNVSTQALAANAGLLLNCGMFSYAEIPARFAFIAGVTVLVLLKHYLPLNWIF